MPTAEKPSCFVVCPIGEPDSATRKRADKVLTHVFEAALGDEYKVMRADKISEPGMITSQILRALQDSDLVIADLTEHNANVFYELAVRHAVEKPVIHVIDSHFKIPFDVAGFRTIVFDFTDLDSVAEAIKLLKQQASETRSGKQGETPIKLANIMRRSKEDSTETVLLKQAVEGIAALSSEFQRLIYEMGNEIRVPLQSQIDYLTNILTPASSLSPTWQDAATSGMLSAHDGSSAATPQPVYGRVPLSYRRIIATPSRPPAGGFVPITVSPEEAERAHAAPLNQFEDDKPEGGPEKK